jgi:hypothetical protein
MSRKFLLERFVRRIRCGVEVRTGNPNLTHMLAKDWDRFSGRSLGNPVSSGAPSTAQGHLTGDL